MHGKLNWRFTHYTLMMQYRERIIFLGKAIDEETGNQLVATMLYLDSENKKDLNLYINCSGGDVSIAELLHWCMLDTIVHLSEMMGCLQLHLSRIVLLKHVLNVRSLGQCLKACTCLGPRLKSHYHVMVLSPLDVCGDISSDEHCNNLNGNNNCMSSFALQ